MKIRKRILNTILILSLILGIMPTIKAQGAGENLTINPVIINAQYNQSDIIVPFYVSNTEDLLNIVFTVSYDNSLVEYIGIDEDDVGQFAKSSCNQYFYLADTDVNQVEVTVSRSSCGAIDVDSEIKVIDLHFSSLGVVGSSLISVSAIAHDSTGTTTIAGFDAGHGDLIINPAPTPEVNITPNPDTINIGDASDLTISVNDALDMFGFYADVTYDPAVLSYNLDSEIIGTELVSGNWTVFVDFIEPGLLSVLADADMDALNGDLDIITLNFDSIADGQSDIIFADQGIFTLMTDSNYDPIDANWNNGSVVVEVPDTTAPVITLIGSSAIELTVGDDYDDAGATALDDIDGDITTNIVTINTVDTNTADTYIILYNVSDAASNLATEVARTVVVEEAPIVDTTDPDRSAASPSGAQSSGTTQVSIGLTTDEDASCKYSTIANTSYASSTDIFASTGSTTHSTAVSGLSNGQTYNYYVRCEDANGNSNVDDYPITFSVSNPSSSGSSGSSGSYTPPSDTTAPAQVSALRVNRTENNIALNWENPADSDLAGVLVVKVEDEVDSYIGALAAKELGETVYDGILKTYTDDNIASNLVYYYLVYTYDEVPNYSNAQLIKTSPLVDTVIEEIEEVENKNTSSGVKYTNLGGVDSSIVEEVSGNEARTIHQYDKFVNMDAIYVSLYNKVVSENDGKVLSPDSKYSIAYFVRYGSDTTIILGAGERAGVVNSYKSVFSKLPQTEEEWKDVVKIANGRWPSEQNISAEQKAQAEIFKTIYKREANMENANDNAAVTVITYGLRPADRNMDSEKAGIKIFKSIFGHNPSLANEWDIVRAISYSGATR
ncbi:MAG: DUF5011 domain-containing protein [Patescibacteria group bacterium]|jgi:hypothetical protein|nr:DUF5011 domain-containing protein [Patescibacteria group bacterium]